MADNKSWDVIVIGAGLSGLAAATSLVKKGYSVLILEALNVCGHIFIIKNSNHSIINLLFQNEACWW